MLWSSYGEMIGPHKHCFLLQILHNSTDWGKNHQYFTQKNHNHFTLLNNTTIWHYVQYKHEIKNTITVPSTSTIKSHDAQISQCNYDTCIHIYTKQSLSTFLTKEKEYCNFNIKLCISY